MGKVTRRPKDDELHRSRLLFAFSPSAASQLLSFFRISRNPGHTFCTGCIFFQRSYLVSHHWKWDSWCLQGPEISQLGTTLLFYPRQATSNRDFLTTGASRSQVHYRRRGISSFSLRGIGLMRDSRGLLLWAGRGKVTNHVTLTTSWFPPRRIMMTG